MINFHGKSFEIVDLNANGKRVVFLIVRIKSFILIMVEYVYKCIIYLAELIFYSKSLCG